MSLRYIAIVGCLSITACGDDGAGAASTSKGGNPAIGGTSNSIGQGGSDSGGTSAPNSGGASTSPSPGQGGTPATGGTVAVVGGSSSGPNATGGAPGAGGGENTGGASVAPGAPCSGTCPTGKVRTCFKDGCPMGACDDTGFYASTPCSSLYPSSLSSSTLYCAAGQSGSYCFQTLDNDIFYWVVTCTGGTPSVTHCTGGCGVESNGKAVCS